MILLRFKPCIRYMIGHFSTLVCHYGIKGRQIDRYLNKNVRVELALYILESLLHDDGEMI